MKSNKVIIKVKVPLHRLFIFTTDPINTPLWIDSIVKEERNESPAKIGTIYRNQNQQENWSEYVVTDYSENNIFELRSRNGKYNVRYRYKKIDINTSELEYYEWVTEGELEEPFTQEILNKLKIILENMV